jgi:hypothetical protein
MIPILLTWMTSEEVNRLPSGFRAYPFAEQSANCLKIDTERLFWNDRIGFEGTIAGFQNLQKNMNYGSDFNVF